MRNNIFNLWFLLFFSIINSKDIPIVNFSTSMACIDFPYVQVPSVLERIYYLNNWINSPIVNQCNLIPKIIHIIWLGSDLPSKYKSLVDTWAKYHPDWKIIFWDDQAVDKLNLHNKNLYNKSSNYGFKSDLARYEILYRFGGLYVDTDFECLNSFDFLHAKYAFYAGLFPNQGIVGNSILASSPGHPIMQKCVNQINALPQIINGKESDVSIQQISGPQHLTRCVLDYIVQNEQDQKIIILPAGYFYAFPVTKSNSFWSGEISTEDAYDLYSKPESMAFHYWACSWVK